MAPREYYELSTRLYTNILKEKLRPALHYVPLVNASENLHRLIWLDMSLRQSGIPTAVNPFDQLCDSMVYFVAKGVVYITFD